MLHKYEMSSLNDLHVAIAKGYVALARDLAQSLKSTGVDITKEIEYAKKLGKMKGGSWKNVYEAVL